MELLSFPEQVLQAFGKFSLDFFVISMGDHKKVLYKGGADSSHFGYPEKVFIEQIEGSFIDLILAEDQDYVTQALQKATEAKTDVDVQFHLIHYDNSVSLIRAAGSFLYCQDDAPVYLFFVADEAGVIAPFSLKREGLILRFSVGTGSLIRANVQGSVAFLVSEFTNLYQAISTFSSRYVHPDDRKAFACFLDERTLCSSFRSKEEHKDIPFRRTSFNEAFAGYRWSVLSYSLQESSEGLVCELCIYDSDNVASQLAEKTLLTQLDPLTGVLNRSAFEKEVTRQLALCPKIGCMGAFFMLDIDNFKGINDTYGHDKGDEVLRQVAKAVRGVFRPTDIVARPGGDEFAVFITTS